MWEHTKDEISRKRITDRISQSAAPSILLNMFNAQEQTQT